MSAWARTKPSRLSVRTVSTALISFFIVVPSRTSHRQGGHLADELGDRLVECGVVFLFAQIRHQQRQVARLERRCADLELARMRAAVGGQERVALAGAEMADREDGGDVLLRDRRGVAGAGDLGDEAAMLAERLGEPLARAGRPRFEHARQDLLVGADVVLAGRRRRSRAISQARRAGAAMAALARASCAGATDSDRRPAPPAAPGSQSDRHQRRRRG